MKNVLFLTHNCNFANNFLLPQMSLYEQLGYKVSLASSLDLDHPDKSISKFYDIGIKQSPFKLIQNYKAFINLKRIIDQENISVINCHTPVGGLLGRLLKFGYPEVEVIYTAHGFHFHKGAPLLNWLVYYPVEKYLSRFTDKLITINNEDLNVTKEKKFKPKKTYLVNGVGIEKVQVDTKLSDQIKNKYHLRENTVLLSIGQLNDNKNHRFIIETMPKILMKFPNTKYLILGRGPLENELKDLINTLNLNNHVCLVGYKENVEDYIACSDIVVSASYREGLPKSLMEAIYLGKPCLVSNCRGNRDIIKTDFNGYVYHDFESEVLVLGLSDILNNYDMMSTNARESSAQYLIENIIDDYRIIFEE